jgi:hypothetical protein
MSDKLNEIDEKINKWLAGPKEKVILPPVRPYDEKLVAFIDILGVKDKVVEGGDDAATVVTIMSQIRTYVETECNSRVKAESLHSLQLGDGFFIATDIQCINEICKILSTVQWQVLIESQMLLRGVLTAGKIAVGDDDKYFIGPAVIKAIELERKNAIYPRIIYINKEIDKYVKKQDMNFKYIIEDQDKIKYLDFIRYNIDSEKLTIRKLKQLLTEKEVNKTLKEAYEKKICGDKSVAQKYGWLISKFADHGIKII